MSDATVTARIAIAQARADAARARFSGAIGALQHRAKPKVLAHDVAESLKDKGREALTGAVETAKRQPVPVGIAVTVFGLFLARKPLANLLRQATLREPRS